MPRLKLREFMLFRGGGGNAKAESKGGELANSQRAMNTLHKEMETAGAALKQALAEENEVNRALRRKARCGAADLERLRESRKAVEDCAAVYVAAIRRWRTALQEEISVTGPSSRSGRMSGIPFSLEVAPNFHK